MEFEEYKFASNNTLAAFAVSTGTVWHSRIDRLVPTVDLCVTDSTGSQALVHLTELEAELLATKLREAAVSLRGGVS